MSIQEKSSVFTAPRYRQYATTVLLVVCGVAMSVAVFLAARFWEQRSIQREFDSLADHRFHAINGAFHEFTKLLVLADNILMIAPKADSPGFTDYVRSLRTFLQKDQSRYPSLLAMTWVPRVPRDERDAYERAARAVFDPHFQISQPGSSTNTVSKPQSAEAFPTYLCIGRQLGHGQSGEDLALDPATWKAMTRARDTGIPAAMAPLEMPEAPDDRLGYRVFQPLYHGGDPGDTASRREAIAGFLRVDLDVGKLVYGAFGPLQPVGIDVAVYDDNGANSVLVCQHTSRLKSPATSRDEQGLGDQLEASRATEFLGRKLTLRSLSTRSFWDGRVIWQPWVLLCGGLTLTLTAAGYQLTLASRATSIERAVSTRLTAMIQEGGRQQAKRRQEARPLPAELASDGLHEAVGADPLTGRQSHEPPPGVSSP